MHRAPLAAALLLAGALAGCGSYASYVDSESTALGRVVVYRNGIAFFERQAHVEGSELTLRVPHDKVDDFLKSLTVRDATSGKALPVSFPTRTAAADGMVEMVIQLPPGGPQDIVLSYITEAPAWKPSYRLVITDDGKVNVQGWAIVDNTSGEDWKQVRLGVGSSSALSFRYDLRTVRLVQRETLRAQEQFAAAPPRGGSVHTDQGGETVAVLGELEDAEIPRPDGHPDVTLDLATTETTGGAGGAPAATRGSRYRDSSRVRELARQLNESRANVVLEGYSTSGERDGDRRAMDRANLLRNNLIREGVPPAQLRVVNRGVVSGRGAGVRLVADQRAPSTEPTSGQRREGDPIGESHFESDSTMSVERGTSAMVSILDGRAEGEVVYLYDPEARRGNKRFAFKAVRFKNPTDSTLESGPVTVYGNNRFIGEGLADPIPPHSTAFIPFALDRQVIVERRGSTGDRISRLITVQRGVLTAEMQHTRTTKLTITNRQPLAARVFVRHTLRKGWELTESPELYEKFGEAHLFEVALGPNETKVLELEEATPLTRTIDIRSSQGLNLVKLYLKLPNSDERLREPMAVLLRLYTEMANIEQEIQSHNERLDDFRQRIDELNAQIVNLQSARAGGTRLMRHLRAKMIEMSNRVQASTIAVVNLRQRHLLAKIQFQDGLAELTIEERPAAATASAAAE